MTEYLKAIYDKRKEFYNKAKLIRKEDKLILISYNTEVAYIKDKKAYVLGDYSQTTNRHIKEFLKQNGFKANNIKQIIKDYGVLK